MVKNPRGTRSRSRISMAKFKGASAKAKRLAATIGPHEIKRGSSGEIVIGSAIWDGDDALYRWMKENLSRGSISTDSTGYVEDGDHEGPWVLFFDGSFKKASKGKSKGRKNPRWSTKYKNHLPDSAFLYIAPGGRKDDTGRTVPRSLRYFPVYNHLGQISAAQAKNAIGRIPQSTAKRLTAAKIKKLQDKARKLYAETGGMAGVRKEKQKPKVPKRSKKAAPRVQEPRLRLVANSSSSAMAPLKKASTRVKATSRLHRDVCGPARLERNPSGMAEMVAKHDADKLKRIGWKGVRVSRGDQESWGVSFKPWKAGRGRKVQQVEVFTLFSPSNGGVSVRIDEYVGSRKKKVWSGTFSNPDQAVGITSARITKRAGYHKTKREASGLPPKARGGIGAFLGLSNPSETQKRRKMKPVIDVFHAEQTKAAKVYPELGYVKLEVDTAGEIHDSERHFAQATIDRKDGKVTIQVAPELALEPISVIRGIIRHEFGHAAVFSGDVKSPKKPYRGLTMYDTRERHADKTAERIFKNKIYYDSRGVEVSGPGARGQRPRPKGLK